MLQILQHLGSGETELVSVPAPSPQPGRLLIRASRSVISLGTERMLVEFGRANWLSKARQQPEKFWAVLAKVRAEGLVATLQAIRSKLAQPIPLGYCHVGQILDAGGVAGYHATQRVISNSPHAEVVSAPPHLCALIPDNVDDESAAFTPLAAIALAGIRLAGIQAGDRVGVLGLGLIGQLTVRLLRAMGCEVFGSDPDAAKCVLATQAGAHVFNPSLSGDVLTAGISWSQGQGMVAVLITASTSSSVPVNQAARLCRSRGKVVLIGVTGLHLNRADFYQNEVSFQVSQSYGSTHVDRADSAQANFRQVLAWLSTGDLTVADLITRRVPFAEAASAYADFSDRGQLGILLQYEPSPKVASSQQHLFLPPTPPAGLGLAVIGAGNFAARTLLPALQRIRTPWVLRQVISAQGANAFMVGRRFGALEVGTHTELALTDPLTQAVLIATRHGDHATQAVAALSAGKAVWVEKPLALTEPELDRVLAAARASGGLLMVGFNRRFAPLAQRFRAELTKLAGPRVFTVRVNAGMLPPQHWMFASQTGGGRIVGEACHFVDLLRFLTGSPITAVHPLSRSIDGQDAGRFEMTFADGTSVTLNYLTDLPAHHPKEFIQADGPDWQLCLDNWTKLTGTGKAKMSATAGWLRGPQKGHHEALTVFCAAARSGGPAPVSLDEIDEVSRWSIRMQGMKA